MPVTISAAGVARIREFEGCELKVYLDQAGKATIGVGHLIRHGETFPAEGITEQQAEDLLVADLRPAVEGVIACLEVDVDQAQFDALVSFAFNMGVGSLRSSSFLRSINGRESNEVIREKLMRWNKVTVAGKKEISAGLARRRAVEAEAWP